MGRHLNMSLLSIAYKIHSCLREREREREYAISIKSFIWASREYICWYKCFLSESKWYVILNLVLLNFLQFHHLSHLDLAQIFMSFLQPGLQDPMATVCVKLGTHSVSHYLWCLSTTNPWGFTSAWLKPIEALKKWAILMTYNTQLDTSRTQLEHIATSNLIAIKYNERARVMRKALMRSLGNCQASAEIQQVSSILVARMKAAAGMSSVNRHYKNVLSIAVNRHYKNVLSIAFFERKLILYMFHLLDWFSGIRAVA